LHQLRNKNIVKTSVADPDPNPDPNPDPPDPHVFGPPLVRDMDPDPDTALDPDPSIIMQKKYEKP
jgi:hypothetical protein